MANKFMPDFLAGKEVDMHEVCGSEFEAVKEADAAVNPDYKLPFKWTRLNDSV